MGGLERGCGARGGLGLAGVLKSRSRYQANLADFLCLALDGGPREIAVGGDGSSLKRVNFLDVVDLIALKRIF